VEQAMAGHVAEFAVLGPWSLQTSRRFWEGFTPAALAAEPTGPGLRTVFCAEGDWRRAGAEVTQSGDTAHVVLAGDGDLDAAAGQVCRFLALDVDGRGWPQVGRRDPVIAGAQARLPGLRPCGFHSPYEAAACLGPVTIVGRVAVHDCEAVGNFETNGSPGPGENDAYVKPVLEAQYGEAGFGRSGHCLVGHGQSLSW
jgi:hypothetical protein